MKLLKGPDPHDGFNAWGEESKTLRAVYEIESADVGVLRPHYLGHNHKLYRFHQNDVGRKITVVTGFETNGNYTCWFFD